MMGQPPEFVIVRENGRSSKPPACRFKINRRHLLDARFRGQTSVLLVSLTLAPNAAFALANPASVFCVKSGGKSEIRKGPAGAYGLCRLPDGRVVEEWTYFREMKGKADTPR